MARSPGKAEHRGAPRVPGLISGISVGAVFVLVAAIALTARQEPPPTVAEFAPQAVEQIKEALPEQAEAPDADVAGAPGAAEADDAGRPASESPSEVAQTPEEQASEAARERRRGNNPGDPEQPGEEEPKIEIPRVRRCVGNPPRQTDDPQSPPCVPYFEGDNGGATYKGVTGDEIRVAIPTQGFGAQPPLIQDIVDHFNRRYQFYGRKIVPIFYPPDGGDFAHPDPAKMIADAVKVDEEHKAFASLAYPDRKGAEHHYYDELARRRVISSAYRAQALTSAQRYSEFAPYQWNAMPSGDVMMSGLGNMICGALAGDPPQGGGPQGDGRQFRDPLGQEPHTGPRIFGLVFGEAKDGTVPPVDALEAQLSACDAEPAARVRDSIEVPQGANVISQMRQAKVTSVIYVGDPGPLRATYMQEASNQQYFPEWVVSSYIDMDLDNVFQPITAPSEQSRNILGVSYRNKLLPRQEMPWYWAVRESSPESDPSGGLYYNAMAIYRQLLQLSSGIQMAGPNLTPETFEERLQGADFPNPGAGDAPSYQTEVDYEGRYTASDTASMYFYDPEAIGTVDPQFPGAVCYVNGGRQYPVADMPTGKQAFFGSCR